MSRYGDKAKCRDLTDRELENTFHFPGPHNLGLKPGPTALEHWEAAKEICIECPIFLKCREANWGLDYGVVGGTDQYERYLYRRRNRAALQRKAAKERAETAARLAKRAAVGVSVTALAMGTGYSESTIRDLLNEHRAAQEKPAPVRKPGQLTSEELERVRSMASKGDRPALIATTLGRSKNVIDQALAGLEITAAPQAWPEGRPPRSDAWVWHHNTARTAHYMGQTKDGQWFLMSLRGNNRSPTRKWFPRDSVDLRAQVGVQILEKAGSDV